MHFTLDTINYDPEHQIFWSCVQVEIKADGRKGVAIVGASEAFLNNLFAISAEKKLTEEDKGNWLDATLFDIRREFTIQEDGKPFVKFYDVSDEGKEKGVAVLREL